jgi:GABA(A) receptor-associated protein
MPFFGNSNQAEEPTFATETPLEKRIEEARKVLQKYPERVPVIVERAKNAVDKIPRIDKKKYMVPADMTFGQFTHVVRHRLKLTPEQALFCFVNNIQPTTTTTLGQIFNEHKDAGGFLQIVYACESTFGSGPRPCA